MWRVLSDVYNAPIMNENAATIQIDMFEIPKKNERHNHMIAIDKYSMEMLAKDGEIESAMDDIIIYFKASENHSTICIIGTTNRTPKQPCIIFFP